MSIIAENAVWQHSMHHGSALNLLLAIAWHAHDDGRGAWPSIETLATETRQTRRNVQLLLRRLEKSGELSTVVGAGRRGCNSYTINLPIGQAAAEGVNAPSGGAKFRAQGGEIPRVECTPDFTRTVINNHRTINKTERSKTRNGSANRNGSENEHAGDRSNNTDSLARAIAEVAGVNFTDGTRGRYLKCAKNLLALDPSATAECQCQVKMSHL